MAVDTRTLGRTGLEISNIIFGCGNVGGLLIDASHDEMLAAVKRALDAGINWFDTAAQYGLGKSEKNLGQLLKELNAAPHVSTKVRLQPADFDDIPGAIERHTHASLERLGRQSVDLLQIHNQIAPQAGERYIGIDQVLDPGGVADGLDEMRDQGLTNFIGFTGLGDSGCCQAIAESGRFDTAQVYYNLINPSAARALPETTTGQDFVGLIDALRAVRAGIIAIRVFAAGVIATDVRHDRQMMLTLNTDIDEEAEKTDAVFAVLGDDCGTRAQTAVRFALANPDISGVNVGLAEIAHLEEAIAAAEMGPLPDDALDRLAVLYDRDFGR